jgi:hypothetical protein
MQGSVECAWDIQKAGCQFNIAAAADIAFDDGFRSCTQGATLQIAHLNGGCRKGRSLAAAIRPAVDRITHHGFGLVRPAGDARVLNRSFDSSPMTGEAELRYLDGDYRIIKPGAFVRCAVTGVSIPLEELKYWSVDLQEPYASPQAVMQRQSPPAQD